MTHNPLPQVLTYLAELSNINCQLEAWLENSQGLQSSLIEATEGLYGDSGYDFLLEKNGEVFGSEIDAKLGELFNVIKDVRAKSPNKKMIYGPEMGKVREQASEILTSLKQQPFK